MIDVYGVCFNFEGKAGTALLTARNLTSGKENTIDQRLRICGDLKIFI